MRAALEVDGKRVCPGIACSGVCGQAMSLVCTVNNCTGYMLTNVTLEVLSIDMVPSCLARSFEPNDSDRHAVFDDNAVAVGCLMSAFPQVCRLN